MNTNTYQQVFIWYHKSIKKHRKQLIFTVFLNNYLI